MFFGLNFNEALVKNFEIMNNYMDQMWEAWFLALGSFSWTQAQYENMAKNFIEFGRTNRDESMKMLEETTRQFRTNQTQMQRMIEEAVASNYQSTNLSFESDVDRLAQKIDELSRKLDKNILEQK